MSNPTEQAIATDLDLCDMILAFGTRAAKRKARSHRKACFAEIKRLNAADGFDKLSDDELFAALNA
jgi:hypothetical protein